MQEDPILAELRALREENAASFDHDPDAIFADLRRVQAEHPGKLFRRPSRAAAERREDNKDAPALADVD
jgi:hypothetical protein